MKTLVVAGDAALREMIVSVADGLGYRATVARDGADARARNGREPASLAVVEVSASSDGAFALCRDIRAADPGRETFVLALTDGSSRGELQALIDAGADDYVIMPTGADNLRARLLIVQRRIAEEAQRRAAEEALARARWLAGVGETSIALQHEINNPLTALLGHTELMLLDAKGRGDDAERLRVIHDQARRIAEVVKRLGRLRDPQTVEYAAGARMIDLSEQAKDRS